MKVGLLFGALAASSTTVSARSVARQCYSDICYGLNIPRETARTGSGDIYFQISGPTSYSWIALGQGNDGMAGSNIFVIYTDGKGNVTLSPRLGTGHVEPEHDQSANVTLLEGSGVSRGRMVANVLCSNCDSWRGGSTDFTSSSGSWIHASLAGEPLDSTDADEEIEQHQDHGSFTFDYTGAQGGENMNPFVSGTGNAGVSQPPMSTPASGGSAESSDSDSDSTGAPSNFGTIVTVHGCLASIAFLVLFPAGGIFIRLLTKHVWIHAGIQIFSYCCLLVAAGLGIYMSRTLHLTSEHHPIIGMILFIVLFFQPILGLLHHSAFRQKQMRTPVSHIHIWIGRLSIILGIINGGLGIQLAGDVKRGCVIAYGVVAGVIGTAYLATIAYGEARRRKTSRFTHGREKRQAG